MFLNLSDTSEERTPTILAATPFKDVKAEINISPLGWYFAASIQAGPLPIDRPNRIMLLLLMFKVLVMY